ncbi:MAG: DUF4037 domain-containing protein [Oscillospiraceae bacterium]|nr:DUF4037 domain-containing protein [Oscillospiraceae bacterium]
MKEPYPVQRRLIDHIKKTMKKDPDVLALLLSGSIAHGWHTKASDVDVNIVLSEEAYRKKMTDGKPTHFALGFPYFPTGYVDGKNISLEHLRKVAERGNEPTRFALHDAQVLFDKTEQVSALLEAIGRYPEELAEENARRFYAQLQAWRWYAGEALKKKDRYLLDASVSKLVLFSARLILLENRVFFPYHKWMMRALEEAPQKPDGLLESINRLLENKTKHNIDAVYHRIKRFRDWTGGADISGYFVRDAEMLWLRGEEYIEHI